jgi:hypothetical protein
LTQLCSGPPWSHESPPAGRQRTKHHACCNSICSSASDEQNDWMPAGAPLVDICPHACGLCRRHAPAAGPIWNVVLRKAKQGVRALHLRSNSLKSTPTSHLGRVSPVRRQGVYTCATRRNNKKPRTPSLPLDVYVQGLQGVLPSRGQVGTAKALQCHESSQHIRKLCD